MAKIKPYGFTRRFNRIQACLIMVIGFGLCWGNNIRFFMFGVLFWHMAENLFKSEEPTNLQVLIWGHKRDKK